MAHNLLLRNSILKVWWKSPPSVRLSLPFPTEHRYGRSSQTFLFTALSFCETAGGGGSCTLGEDGAEENVYACDGWTQPTVKSPLRKNSPYIFRSPKGSFSG